MDVKKRVSTPLSGRVGPNFGGSVNNRTKKIFAGILIATMGPFVATTLAASVTLNGGTALEFGQGSNLAIACDTTIGTALGETWVNASSYFKVSSITLSTINNAVPANAAATITDSGCGGKSLKVSLLNSSGAAIVIGSSSETSITITVPTGTTTCVGGSSTAAGASITNTCATATTVTVAIALNSAVSFDASSVARIAIESA